MIRPVAMLLIFLLGAFSNLSLLASDPPHSGATNIQCMNCHQLHNAPGGSLTSVAGNANLCLSCHVSGGLGAGTGDIHAFTPAAQAVPTTGLPAGGTATGTSHRWDSSVAGRISFQGGAALASTGKITTLTPFTGPYAKTYTVTITTAGGVGTAKFSWTTSLPGATTVANVATGASVLLDQGVSLKFTDGAGTSFQVGDKWYLHVRPDLVSPANASLRLDNGQMMCGTCHDPHSQVNTPFDPTAPTTYVAGLTTERHLQRIPNGTDQMCVDCHAGRDVTVGTGGSHPVNVPIPLGNYKTPSTVPLDALENRVRCETCHKVHHAPTNDGSLTRVSNNALCLDCHTLADTTTPARHLSASVGVLWPGGQRGSSFPARTDAALRGACSNCHQPHGWPDSSNTAVKYPNLLVEREENLCFTCHDGSPVTKNVQAEFSKASKHNVAGYSAIHSNSEAAVATTKHVECVDCHNSHMSGVTAGAPPKGMTSPRAALGALKGVRGVTTSNAEINPAAFEYQICFRCHADSVNKPAPKTPRLFAQGNVRLEFAGSYASYHAVAAVSKAGSTSLLSGWLSTSYLACTSCHNNNAGPGNGGSGPNGPHGSTNTTLLERPYTTDSSTRPGYVTYVSGLTGTAGLCWKCHSEATIYNGSGGGFREHRKHIYEEKTSCNVCHDPHASSGYKRLINFDTRYVTKYGANAAPIWKSTGVNQGSCTLTCHGYSHNAENY